VAANGKFKIYVIISAVFIGPEYMDKRFERNSVLVVEDRQPLVQKIANKIHSRQGLARSPANLQSIQMQDIPPAPEQ
jgi:hypothetical protein